MVNINLQPTIEVIKYNIFLLKSYGYFAGVYIPINVVGAPVVNARKREI